MSGKQLDEECVLSTRMQDVCAGRDRRARALAVSVRGRQSRVAAIRVCHAGAPGHCPKQEPVQRKFTLPYRLGCTISSSL